MATSLAILKRTSRSIILLVVCCGAASAQDTTAPTTAAPTAAPTTAAPTTRAPTRAPSLAPTAAPTAAVVETPTCGGEPDPETPCATIDDTNRDALCTVSPFVDQCPAACGTCPVLDCGSTVSEYLSGDGVTMEVMYRNFTASTNLTVTFDTCNQDYDTLLNTTGGAEYTYSASCGVPGAYDNGKRICQEVSAGDTVSVAARFLRASGSDTRTRLQIVTSCSAGACPVPTPSPVTPGPTPEVNYCPSGYADYGVRYNWGLGKTIVADSHQACADRCTRYAGPEYDGGCKAYQTGMYFGMLYCRSYGGNLRNIGCASWAKPTNAGYHGNFNLPLGAVHPRTNRVNVGGNCCSNSTFVEAVAGR